MKHTVAFIVPCRDKAPWVAETVESILAQTYSPMLLVFSDQGSEDGSYEVIEQAIEGYRGPNEIRLVKCPETEYRGMAGYNAHLNWLMDTVDAELFIQSSADDLAHPERAEKVVAAWVEHDVDYVGTMQFALSEDRETVTNAPYRDVPSSHVPLDVLVADRFGGKTSSAWTKSLFEKYGPLKGVECQDLILPFRAALERGFYFLADPLQVYLQRSDSNNLGLEGRLRQAKNEDEEKQIVELINYQMSMNSLSMVAVLEGRVKAGEKLDEVEQKAYNHLTLSLLHQTNAWVNTRSQLTMSRVPPMAFPV